MLEEWYEHLIIDSVGGCDTGSCCLQHHGEVTCRVVD